MLFNATVTIDRTLFANAVLAEVRRLLNERGDMRLAFVISGLATGST